MVVVNNNNMKIKRSKLDPQPNGESK